jgi:hypothetical protein
MRLTRTRIKIRWKELDVFQCSRIAVPAPLMGERLELSVVRWTSCPFFIPVEDRPWRDDGISTVLVLSGEEPYDIQQFIVISLK